jgi:hypothetical protein
MVKELDEKTLHCTRTGQVMLDFDDARSLMDSIRDYYQEHKNVHGKTLKERRPWRKWILVTRT